MDEKVLKILNELSTILEHNLKHLEDTVSKTLIEMDNRITKIDSEITDLKLIASKIPKQLDDVKTMINL